MALRRLGHGTARGLAQKFALNKTPRSCHGYPAWRWDGVDFAFLETAAADVLAIRAEDDDAARRSAAQAAGLRVVAITPDDRAGFPLIEPEGFHNIMEGMGVYSFFKRLTE